MAAVKIEEISELRSGEHAVLGIHPQVQIDGGEPALAVIQQGLDLLVGKLGAAAADVDGELGMVEAELLDADLVDLRAQPDDGGGGQEDGRGWRG